MKLKLSTAKDKKQENYSLKWPLTKAGSDCSDRIGLWIGSDSGSDRIGLRIGSDWQFALNSRQKWSRDIPRNEDGGEKSMYTIFCN